MASSARRQDTVSTRPLTLHDQSSVCPFTCQRTDASNQVFDLTNNTSPIRCLLGFMIQCPLSTTCLIHTALIQNKQQVQRSNFSVVDNGVPGFEPLHVLGLLFCRTHTGFILSFFVNSFLPSK